MSDAVAEGLGRSARIMLGEGGAAAGIDASRAGIRLSFLGVAMALVIESGVLSIGIDPEGELTRGAAFLRLMGLGLASYAAAVATVLVLTREPAQRARIPAWIAARNWADAVLAAVLMVPMLILVSTPSWRVEGAEVQGSPALASALVLGIAVIGFLAHYRLLRHVLGVTALRAFWTVVAMNVSATVAGIALG